jgi:hypothetical protein
MTPTHPEGQEAARRVYAAVKDGGLAFPDDAITMLLYQLSLELRRLPEAQRQAEARRVAKCIVKNTSESLG